MTTSAMPVHPQPSTSTSPEATGPYRTYFPLLLKAYTPLHAAFTYTPTIVYPNMLVYFTDQSTGNPKAWQWDFGDGYLSNLQNPTHTYALTGTYTVCLTVTNLSEVDTATDVITVEAAPPTELELIVNGGFEKDEAWYIPPGVQCPAKYTAEDKHVGQRSMLLGIKPSNADAHCWSSVRQAIAIPADANSATFSFWYKPFTEEATWSDWQGALVLDSDDEQLATLMMLNSNSRAWSHQAFDLTPYAGRVIKVYFNVFNNGVGNKRTWMYLDDVSVKVRIEGASEEFHVGWAVEAYPELSKEAMRGIVRRQRKHGADVVWIGHNNPGEVDRNKAEPGLSYAVYRAYIDPTNPLHVDAKDLVEAQYRMLDACRGEGMKVVLPVGYQIQMGSQWNAAHPYHLRRDYNGNPLDIGGISASFYSPAYRTDIQGYYEWVNANFIQPYKDIILMINLADEPQGGDYSSHANAVFTDRYGFSFWQVGTDSQKWRELGQFQANYIVEYAIWSANLWHQIAPEIQTTMSFCGLVARYGYLMPDIEPLFRDTPPSFVVTFDAYPRDGPPTEPITDPDLTSLFILIRALGHYSRIYDKPLWLWSTANSWGLGQASLDKGDIADAVANLYYLAGLATQTGGKLGGIVFWNYNLKGQGLYNDTNPIVYDPDEMFERVSAAGGNVRDIAAAPSPVSVLLFAPSSYPYELIGKTKSWLHITCPSRDLPNLRSLISSSALNYKYWDLSALARNNVNSVVSPDLKSEDLQGVETILVLAPSLDYVSANELNTLYDFYLQGEKVVAKTQIAEVLKDRMANPQLTAITPYLTKITSPASVGSIYSTAQDVETIFSDAYQGEGALASFWKEVLDVEKLNGGYFVQGERDALLYTITPAYFDVSIPFPYEGVRYDRSGRSVEGLSGSGSLNLTLHEHEYARICRAR